MRKDFGVASAAKSMSRSLELAAQELMVVELAVLNRPHLAALVREGLVPALDVDDAEPAYAEGDSSIDVGSTVVRAAMSHDVGHPIERGRLDYRPRLPADLDDSADSAHLP